MKGSLKVGDEVTLLAPHLDAGARAVVRIVDVGGAMVELAGHQPCYTWVGVDSLRRRPRRARLERSVSSEEAAPSTVREDRRGRRQDGERMERISSLDDLPAAVGEAVRETVD